MKLYTLIYSSYAALLHQVACKLSLTQFIRREVLKHTFALRRSSFAMREWMLDTAFSTEMGIIRVEHRLNIDITSSAGHLTQVRESSWVC